jgi:hypothetical protein
MRLVKRNDPTRHVSRETQHPDRGFEHQLGGQRVAEEKPREETEGNVEDVCFWSDEDPGESLSNIPQVRIFHYKIVSNKVFSCIKCSVRRDILV